MVRLLISAALLSASAAVAQAEPADKPVPQHHHATKTAAPAAAAPTDDAPVPEQMRGWFEGAVGNILSDVGDIDDKLAPAKK